MALEAASYVAGLNTANPTAADPIAEGDNHIRLIKSVLKNTFPNLSAAMTADATELNKLDGVTATTAELNKLAGLLSTTAELNRLVGLTQNVNTIVPAGVIALWSGSAASIPAGWVICDGLNGTPDLRDRFVVGAGSSYAVADVGGQNAITSVPAHTHGVGTLAMAGAGGHSHTGTTASDGAHAHSITTGTGSNGSTTRMQSYGTATGTSSVAGAATSAGAHTHTFTTSTVADHTHTLSGSTASAGVASVDTRPPYYALCFIMKV